jgi:hypothetical protein
MLKFIRLWRYLWRIHQEDTQDMKRSALLDEVEALPLVKDATLETDVSPSDVIVIRTTKILSASEKEAVHRQLEHILAATGAKAVVFDDASFSLTIQREDMMANPNTTTSNNPQPRPSTTPTTTPVPQPAPQPTPDPTPSAPKSSGDTGE